MKKEEKKFNFKKTLIITAVVLIVVVAAFFYKKDYCEPARYTLVDMSSVDITNQLEDWFNSFGGEFHCLDSRENANLVSGKANQIVCGIKPQENGEYTVEVAKANARINKPAEIARWFQEREWSGNAVKGELIEASILISIPEGMEKEAMSLEVLLRNKEQLVATETLYFNVIEKDSFRESIC